MKRALVTGAGGFIGHHLVNYLKARGYWVRGVDIKEPEFAPTAADEFLLLDLRVPGQAALAFVNVTQKGQSMRFDEVYALAADMGGMGYIAFHDADILASNAMININTISLARQAGAERYLFTSSACVYPEHLQLSEDVAGLQEADAYPAAPDTEYGWEKLFAERLVQAYARDYGMTTRIARFHNIYGPLGTWTGGREKAPAALCRKVAEVSDRDAPAIDVWGDGEQTRSFCYIDDCVEGIYRLMHSDYGEPLNIGSDRMVSINELVDMIGHVAGVSVDKRHDLSRPQGVRGRNSDNSLCRTVLEWEPQTCLEDGISHTYAWIAQQVRAVRTGA
jgi:nucleoside-diphosphate-sugar epimerase